MRSPLRALLPQAVQVCEVGPRDGLQSEPRLLSVAARQALVRDLAATGLRRIEIGAFVSPRWVPQMAGTAEVAVGLGPLPGIVRSALVPNAQGLDRALAAGLEEVAVFTAASETFCRRNINCSIDESLTRFAPLVARARQSGIAVRGYVSCMAVCPYEGPVEASRVVAVAAALHRMGCTEIALADTVGLASPVQTDAVLRAAAGNVPATLLALHPHDTYGLALANVLVALEHGVVTIDAAVAGLGGCPYAPGAGGNLATEDLVHMLDRMGIATGVDLDALVRVGEATCRALARSNGARIVRPWTTVRRG